MVFHYSEIELNWKAEGFFIGFRLLYFTYSPTADLAAASAASPINFTSASDLLAALAIVSAVERTSAIDLVFSSADIVEALAFNPSIIV